MTISKPWLLLCTGLALCLPACGSGGASSSQGGSGSGGSLGGSPAGLGGAVPGAGLGGGTSTPFGGGTPGSSGSPTVPFATGGLSATGGVPGGGGSATGGVPPMGGGSATAGETSAGGASGASVAGGSAGLGGGSSSGGSPSGGSPSGGSPSGGSPSGGSPSGGSPSGGSPSGGSPSGGSPSGGSPSGGSPSGGNASGGIVDDTEAVDKHGLDFVVGVDGDFAAARRAAENAQGQRFVMFFPTGDYDIGTLTGDGNQMTTFTPSNVSFIGQDSSNTMIYNRSRDEGISITATLALQGDNAYFQDISIMNKAVYGNESQYSVTGRHVVIMEQASRIIYKDVRLLSTQDTYWTRGTTQTYWEGGEIHGTTDFLCGDGDVFFNGVLLREMKKSAITAASTTTRWGYVFKDCTIDGTVSDFTLGRSWNTAKTVFIDTTMKRLPSAAGWGNPMNSAPQLYGEYNSMKEDGSAVDLSGRRTNFDGKVLQTVLSDSQAAEYTIENVLSGWDPQRYTKQIAAPVAAQEGSTLTWNYVNGARCWVVFRDGVYLDDVITNDYDLSGVSAGATLTVRAANEMGGLSAVSNAVLVQ